MKLINKYQLEIKKSKFIAYYYEIDSIKEINNILESIKKEHKRAKHFPYAYKFDLQVKKSEDKEPSNTAGLPILNVILQNNLNHTLIVVVRYFGGIKLGTGGLYRAYAKAALNAIN